MVKQLTKQSSENEIKAYFTEVMKLAQSDEQYPVNLDEVWPLVYARKDKAVRALQDNNLFIQGIDYQVLTKNGEQKETLLPQNGEQKEILLAQNGKQKDRDPRGGSNKETYLLSLPCLEFFIARKVRPVFEVYRQVFHKTAQALNDAAKKDELTRDSLVDEWGDPVIDLRLYYEFLAAYKTRKYTDWMRARFQFLGFTEGKDYAVTDESHVDTVRHHAAREYALSMRAFTSLVRLDSLRNKKPDTRRRLYDLLHLLRECDEREQAGRITMTEYVNTVRQRVYGTSRVRICHRRVERPTGEGKEAEKPFSIYDPLPMPEDLAPARGQEPLIPSLLGIADGPTSLVATMRRLALFNHEITRRFDAQMQLTAGNDEVRAVRDRYDQAYSELRNNVGNLAFIEAANLVDGEINGFDTLKSYGDKGKEAAR